MTTEDKAEELAKSFAKATLRPYLVVNNNGHFFAVPKPISTGFAWADTQAFLKRIGATVESEWDTTGRRA